MKLPGRFVALLLVPCLALSNVEGLAAKPIAAAIPARGGTEQASFNQEALMLSEETSWRPLHVGAASWFRRLFRKSVPSSVAPMSETEDPIPGHYHNTLVAFDRKTHHPVLLRYVRGSEIVDPHQLMEISLQFKEWQTSSKPKVAFSDSRNDLENVFRLMAQNPGSLGEYPYGESIYEGVRLAISDDGKVQGYRLRYWDEPGGIEVSPFNRSRKGRFDYIGSELLAAGVVEALEKYPDQPYDLGKVYPAMLKILNDLHFGRKFRPHQAQYITLTPTEARALVENQRKRAIKGWQKFKPAALASLPTSTAHGAAAPLPIDIRVARADDASAIMALFDRVYPASNEKPVWWGESSLTRDLASSGEKIATKGFWLVAISHERVIGVIEASFSDLSVAYLHELMVDPDFRGQKIGGRLVARAEEWVRSFANIRLITAISAHLHAKNIYDKRGYVVTSLTEKLTAHELALPDPAAAPGMDEPQGPSGGAASVKGEDLTQEQKRQIIKTIRRDYLDATRMPPESAAFKDLPPALKEGLKGRVLRLDTLTPFDPSLIAYAYADEKDGRSGIYGSPKRLDDVARLAPENREVFWRHEYWQLTHPGEKEEVIRDHYPLEEVQQEIQDLDAAPRAGPHPRGRLPDSKRISVQLAEELRIAINTSIDAGHFSQASLARAVNVHHTTISKFLHRKICVSAALYEELWKELKNRTENPVVGIRFEELRIAINKSIDAGHFTQSSLARAVNVHPSTINKFLNKVSAISAVLAEKIWKVLKRRLPSVLGGVLASALWLALAAPPAMGQSVGSTIETPQPKIEQSGAHRHPFSSKPLPAAVQRCILLSRTLCDAVFDDPPVRTLLFPLAAATFSDGFMTRRGVTRGWSEGNPVARPFIGREPTWSRMAPTWTAEGLAYTWLAERMKNSRHLWLKRLYWVPQTWGIVEHTYGAVGWIRFLRANPNGPGSHGPMSNLREAA